LPLVIYNFPQSTGYDIPAEIVLALAEHPQIAAIKESCGVMEKVKQMFDGTRHIRRSVAVTERFEPVTARMLKKANSIPAGELVTTAALVGATGNTGTPKPSSSAVQVVGNLKTRRKEVGFQVLVGSAQKLLASLEIGAVGAILA